MKLLVSWSCEEGESKHGRVAMAWRAFNALMGNARLLVLDTRSPRSYADRHIRGSVCVKLSSNGRTLERVAGPGPPTWSKNCWWDRNILIVSPNYSRKREGKGGRDDDEETGERDRKRRRKGDQRGDEADPLLDFLLQEGLVRSVKVLEVGDEESKDSFSLFARQYPFLVTKSTKPAVISSYPSEIVPGLLYLGDLGHAKAESRLEDLGITHILTIHTEPLTLEKQFVQMFFNLADESGADIRQHFDPMYDFVEKARKEGGRVLVHCGAGASRSATLCAAYLMRVRGWNAKQTLKFLKEQRKQVAPNDGFLVALDNYEKELALGPTMRASSSRNSAPVETIDRSPGGNSDLQYLTADVSASGRTEENPYLEVLKEGRVVGTVALPQTSQDVVFGRASTCDIVLDHASISRRHARISSGGGQKVWIQDMGSAHGTFLKGKQLLNGERQRVHGGDTLRFGASTRSYVLQGAVQ